MAAQSEVRAMADAKPVVRGERLATAERVVVTRTDQRVERANVWPFIEVEEAGQGNVRTCELLEVSRAAYYEQRKHLPSVRELDDAELTDKIKTVHDESKGTYGAPRIHAQLARDGIRCGKKRVARLMVRAGLAGRCPRRWRLVAEACTKLLRVQDRMRLLDSRWDAEEAGRSLVR